MTGAACRHCNGREGRAFSRVRGAVSHSIPRSRQLDSGIHDLVAADTSCKQRKRDFAAANPHLKHRLDRFDKAGFVELVRQVEWTSHAAEARSVAAAIYAGLP